MARHLRLTTSRGDADNRASRPASRTFVVTREAAVHAHPSGRRVPTTPTTTVRRFGGPRADQLFVLCRPSAGTTDPSRQAESVYEALRDALASEHVEPETVVTETVFCRRVRDHVTSARSARSRVLGD